MYQVYHCQRESERHASIFEHLTHSLYSVPYHTPVFCIQNVVGAIGAGWDLLVYVCVCNVPHINTCPHIHTLHTYIRVDIFFNESCFMCTGTTCTKVCAHLSSCDHRYHSQNHKHVRSDASASPSWYTINQLHSFLAGFFF